MAEPAKRRKTTVIHVRLTEEEHELFAGFCVVQGLTHSEAIRRLVRAATFLGPTFEGEARAEVVALTRQLRAVGVNLNQAVRHMNAGHMASSADVTEWLTAARGVIVEITSLYRSLCARAQQRAQRALAEPAE